MEGHPGDGNVGGQVARVVETKNPDYPKGKLLVGSMGWSTYSVVDPSATQVLHLHLHMQSTLHLHLTPPDLQSCTPPSRSWAAPRCTWWSRCPASWRPPACPSPPPSASWASPASPPTSGSWRSHNKALTDKQTETNKQTWRRQS